MRQTGAFIAAALAVLMASACSAAIVSRTVVLPDGTPAIDAKVTVRLLDDAGRLAREVTGATDENGRFDFPVEPVIRPDLPDAWFRAGYVIIDMPGYALTLTLLDWRTAPRPDPPTTETLKLQRVAEMPGSVLGMDLKPCADVPVAVSRAVGREAHLTWPLNDPARGVSTPQLAVRSGADGKFALRGIAVDGLLFPRCYVTADAPATTYVPKLFPSGNDKFIPWVKRAEPEPPPPSDVLPEPGFVKRQILLTDGTPAVGAKVTVRLFGADGLWQQDIPATTDQDGRFRVAAEIPPPSSDPTKPSPSSYVIVDAPDSALMLALANWRQPLLRGAQPTYVLRLQPPFEFAGTAVGADKAPLAGVKVSLSYLSGNNGAPWRLNYAPAKVTTPEATALSGAEGSFKLRGIVVEKDSMMTGYFYATAPGLSTRYLPYINWRPDTPPFTIMLVPTVSFGGTVTDTEGKGVPGASVRLIGDPEDAVRQQTSVTTDAQGRFTFPNLPQLDAVYVHASHPQYASRWQEVDLKQPQAPVTVALPALTTISGKIIDEDTGQPPVAPRLWVQTASGTLASTPRSMVSLPKDIHGVAVGPDGVFTVPACVGENNVSVGQFCYALPRGYALTVPPGGLQDVELRVQKTPGYYLKVEGAADKLNGLSFQLRRADLKPFMPGTNIVQQGTCAWSAREWGEQVEIQFYRDRQPVTDWLPITADKAAWPRVIEITK
jgi:5-hydroxyisourate hydrolase-like protein (transthyretin family)